MKEQF